MTEKIAAVIDAFDEAGTQPANYVVELADGGFEARVWDLNLERELCLGTCETRNEALHLDGRTMSSRLSLGTAVNAGNAPEAKRIHLDHRRHHMALVPRQDETIAARRRHQTVANQARSHLQTLHLPRRHVHAMTRRTLRHHIANVERRCASLPMPSDHRQRHRSAVTSSLAHLSSPSAHRTFFTV
jgi:hypothetical protein